MAEVIHIAGLPLQVGSQLRQRCGWCGCVLLDEDLSSVQVAVTDTDTVFVPYPTWPDGDLVSIDGPMRRAVPHQDGDQLPEGAYAHIPHGVTGHRSTS